MDNTKNYLSPPLGAWLHADGSCGFRVWAPGAAKVELCLLSGAARNIAMDSCGGGYFATEVPDVPAGALYQYRLDEHKMRPDPASSLQYASVHGPSVIVDRQFEWGDGRWKGIKIAECVIYELHVGTFTPEGTFEAIIPRLPELKSLGITAIELMPVAQFPGHRNWGYDGALPFAVQNSYGGPTGLKKLVNACHLQNIAIVLDVVYNHLGPEGNYLSEFGPYFSNSTRTPWGEALNFDGPLSDQVRSYFLQNAQRWIGEFHFDGLRLDAINTIVDSSASLFLEELSQTVHSQARELGRQVVVIAECSRNDPKTVQPVSSGGLGMDAVWNDDFHASLHFLLTGERHGQYRDCNGVADLGLAMSEGFVMNTSRYSHYRQKSYGRASSAIPAEGFVVFSQNHDQVGNRAGGERLAALVSFEQTKLAAACVLLSANTPLLFMGEEYGEPAPFHYFISHDDADLIEAVRRGRNSSFGDTDSGTDPHSATAFESSKLHWELRNSGRHNLLWNFYQECLRIRREMSILSQAGKKLTQVTHFEDSKTLLVRSWTDAGDFLMLLNFSNDAGVIPITPQSGTWDLLLNSNSGRWGGPTELKETFSADGFELKIQVPPWSAALYSLRSFDDC